MKTLSEYIPVVKPVRTLNMRDVPIEGIAYLAEDIRRGDLFCGISEFLKYGQWVEADSQIGKLNGKDPAALLINRPVPDSALPQLIVEDTVKSMADAARFFYDYPDRKFKLVGVTGTNGKTTIAHLCRHILSFAGKKSGCLGTIGMYVDDKKISEAIYTTPLSPDLYKTLDELAQMNVETVSMEVSSHSLKLDRVWGLEFDAAVFTNLTQDHLDFHKTMEDYYGSKEKLFRRLAPGGFAVVNMDDPAGRKIAKSANGRVLGYGLCESMSEKADVFAENVECFPDRTRMEASFEGRRVLFETRLTGLFNVYNTLAAAAVGYGFGIDPETLRQAVASFSSVPGRMEVVELPGRRTAVVDYAHTPDALKNVLETLRKTARRRIITVFGCGGDRDREKRPLMGAAAARLSDVCIVTSDNPRREDPMEIIDMIVAGMDKEDLVVEPDRRKAIREAYRISEEEDIILVAGKGHEDYQILGTEKIHFSDKEELICLADGPADSQRK